MSEVGVSLQQKIPFFTWLSHFGDQIYHWQAIGHNIMMVNARPVFNKSFFIHNLVMAEAADQELKTGC